MRMITLQSTQLASIGFDPGQEILVAQFQNGSFYRYEGVPAETYVAILTDDKSHGHVFNELVKAKDFSFTKIEPSDVQAL